MNKSTVHVASNLGPKQRLFRPVVLATVLAVIVVVTLVVLAVQFAKRNQKTEPVQKALKNAGQSYAAGEYQDAYNELKAAEKQATGDDEKFNLYNNLAAAASSAGNVGDAIHYYNLKHEVRPETISTDAYLMGTLYERSGDKQKALEQYRIALEFEKGEAKKTKNDARVRSLEVRISDLEAQP